MTSAMAMQSTVQTVASWSQSCDVRRPAASAWPVMASHCHVAVRVASWRGSSSPAGSSSSLVWPGKFAAVSNGSGSGSSGSGRSGSGKRQAEGYPRMGMGMGMGTADPSSAGGRTICFATLHCSAVGFRFGCGKIRRLVNVGGALLERQQPSCTNPGIRSRGRGGSLSWNTSRGPTTLRSRERVRVSNAELDVIRHDGNRSGGVSGSVRSNAGSIDGHMAKWRDIIELKFLEDEDSKPTPMPPFPQIPHAGQPRTPRKVLEADAVFVRGCIQRVRWFANTWRVPLDAVEGYDADHIAAYFARRPHLLLLRMGQVAGVALHTWAQVVQDTYAIRSAEARGVHLDSPEISRIRRRTADHIKAAMLNLGPTFVKVAQSLSARPDVIGPDTASVLSELQDRLPAFPTEEALAVIEEELNVPSASALFPHMGAEPVAAASFGQVYYAEMEGGERVAVKVQRPNVLFTVARDICILRILLRVVRKVAGVNADLGLLADEFGRALYGELDYRQEAENAVAFARAHAHMERVVVPKVLLPLTSRRVLTMEWVDGERPADLLALAQGKQLPEQQGGGDSSSLHGRAVSEQQQAWARERLLAMVGIGVECSLEQLLVTGLLHADPHPGNLLLMADGRVAYLDFGLLCRMLPQHQAAMLAAVAHLVNGEWASLANDLAAMDVLKPSTDRQAITLALEEAFAPAVRSPTTDGAISLKFGQMSSELWRMALRFRFRLPPYYTLVLRSLASLEGIGVAADPDFRAFACAYPYVVRRLLTDSSPSSQQVLRDLVLTREGRLRWDRFAAFAASSKTSSVEAAALAAPSLMRRHATTYAAATPTASYLQQQQQQHVSGPQSRKQKQSQATIVLDLLLSNEAASARRMLLDSDMQSLGEAFVSRSAAPARQRLAEVIVEFLLPPHLRDIDNSGASNASADAATLPIALPVRLLPAPSDNGAVADGLLSAAAAGSWQPTPFNSSCQSLPAAYRAGPTGAAATSGVGLLHSMPQQQQPRQPEQVEQQASAAIRWRRLRLLLLSALSRMEGGPVLKARVVLTALSVAWATFLLYAQRVLADWMRRIAIAVHVITTNAAVLRASRSMRPQSPSNVRKATAPQNVQEEPQADSTLRPEDEGNRAIPIGDRHPAYSA